MRCVDARDELTVAGMERDTALQQHLDDCPACSQWARAVGRLDDRLRAALVVDPPVDLRLQLASIARAAAPTLVLQARPARTSIWRDAVLWVAAVAMSLAAWQLYAWILASTLVLGDVVDAVQVTVAAIGLPSDFELDPLALSLWALAGAVAWLVANSPARPAARAAR